MRIERRFTEKGQSPYDRIEWSSRNSVIYNPDGSAVFEMKDAQIPSGWSQLATDIMVSKYFRKAGVPEKVIAFLTGGGATRLTNDPGNERDPSWAPDGRTIAFQSDRGDGPEAVYVKSADGSGEAELVGHSDHWIAPSSWSPDGKQIAILIQKPETQVDIAILSVEDGSIEPFLSTEFIEYGPVYSPDGKWIAYNVSVPRQPLTDDDGAAWSELHVVDVEGTSRPFITGKVNIGACRWMPWISVS